MSVLHAILCSPGVNYWWIVSLASSFNPDWLGVDPAVLCWIFHEQPTISQLSFKSPLTSLFYPLGKVSKSGLRATLCNSAHLCQRKLLPCSVRTVPDIRTDHKSFHKKSRFPHWRVFPLSCRRGRVLACFDGALQHVALFPDVSVHGEPGTSLSTRTMFQCCAAGSKTCHRRIEAGSKTCHRRIEAFIWHVWLFLIQPTLFSAHKTSIFKWSREINLIKKIQGIVNLSLIITMASSWET